MVQGDPLSVREMGVGILELFRMLETSSWCKSGDIPCWMLGRYVKIGLFFLLYIVFVGNLTDATTMGVYLATYLFDYSYFYFVVVHHM